MRGHTSDRVLCATLRGEYRDAQREIERHSPFPDDMMYFQGKADALQALWHFLALKGEINEHD